MLDVVVSSLGGVSWALAYIIEARVRRVVRVGTKADGVVPGIFKQGIKVFLVVLA